MIRTTSVTLATTKRTENSRHTLRQSPEGIHRGGGGRASETNANVVKPSGFPTDIAHLAIRIASQKLGAFHHR